MSNLIFLSHSSKDEKLVEKFVDFLVTSLSIRRSDIFCTSLHGTKKLRTGYNFIQDIRDNILNTKLVLFFITPNFLKSDFCLCELGAAWALGEEIYPILVPPTDYSDLDTTPLKGVTQFLKLNHSENCIQLGDEFKALEVVEDFSSVLLKKKAESFFEEFKELQIFEDDPTVSIEEYQKLHSELEMVADEISQKDKEVKKLNDMIEELKRTKDSSEITNILIAHNEEWEVFEKYIENLIENISNVNEVVISCIYYNEYYPGEEQYWIKDMYYFNQAKEMEADEYLIIDYGAGEIKQNIYHPKVKKVLYSIEDLKWFMNEKASEELSQTYEEKYEDPFSIRSRQFWERHFGVSIIMN